MYKKILNSGDRFSDWIVIEQLEEKKHGHLTYKVKCVCGHETVLAGCYLRAMKSPCCRSCSAKKRTPKGKKNKFFKHGASMIGNPLRSTNKTWVVMKQRCDNPNSRDYKNYGERGITYSDNWSTFEGFFKDMGCRPKGLSLERINNDGNYCKENCKWASRKEQNNNRRDNTFFIIDGKRVTRTQIQEKLNWTRDMYRRRYEKHGNEWIVDQYKS